MGRLAIELSNDDAFDVVKRVIVEVVGLQPVCDALEIFVRRAVPPNGRRLVNSQELNILLELLVQTKDFCPIPVTPMRTIKGRLCEDAMVNTLFEAMAICLLVFPIVVVDVLTVKLHGPHGV